MAHSNIPSLSKQNLDLFGAESAVKKWKEDFYTRIIQQTVNLNIDGFDYKDLQGIERAKALQKFINQWNDADLADNLLVDMLKNFTRVANQSLPWSITRRLISPYMKKVIEEAYQRLIFLEVIYHIEKLIQAEKEKTKNAQLNEEWRAIEGWVSPKKAQLVPRFSFKHTLIEIKLTLFGMSFENAYAWAMLTAPFIIKRAFLRFINSPRRIFNPNQSFLANLFYLALTPFQFALYPAALFFGVFFQLFDFVTRLFFLPFNLIEVIFSNEILSGFVVLFQMVIGIAAFQFALIYAIPYLLPVLFYSMVIPLTTMIIGGIPLLLIEGLFRLFGKETPLLDKRSPAADWIEATVICLSALLPSVNATKLMAFANQIIHIVVQGFALYRQCDAFAAQSSCTPENLSQRQKLYDDLGKQYRRGLQLIEQDLGMDLSAFGQRFLPTTRQKLRLDQEQQVVDYDKDKLIRRIMILKSNMNKTKEELGPEAAQQLTTMNPHTYLASFKTKAELPAYLQVMAVPPEASAPEPAEQATTNRAVA